MNCTKTNLRNALALSLAFSLILGFGQICLADPVCDNNNGNSPYVCVNKSGDAPQSPTDFVFDFSDAANPDVTFYTGNLDWVVWSQVSAEDDTPANLGDLKIDPSVSTDDFELTIANGELAGAANLGSAAFTDGEWTGYSSIEGGKITGNLTGNLTVVEDASEDGGELTLEIGGNVTGNITATMINDLDIGGNMSGDVTADGMYNLTIEGDFSGSAMSIGETTALGTLQIDGDLSGDVTIESLVTSSFVRLNGDVISGGGVTVMDMDAVSFLFFGSQGTQKTWNGDLTIESGIPENGAVVLYGALGSTGCIDLEGNDIDGMLQLIKGGSGQVCNVGDVYSSGSNGLMLAGGGSAFSGSASVVSVSYGSIRTDGNGDMTGSIEVANEVGLEIDIGGDFDGDISIGGYLKSGGQISVGGNSTGVIDIVGNVAGDIDIAGDVSDDIIVGGGLSGTISIDGDFESSAEISVVGNSTGDITVGGAGAGDISITGDAGDIAITGNASGDVDIDGDLDGDLTVGGYLSGDVTVDGDLTGSVDVEGSLTSTGRVRVEGMCNAPITVGGETASLSQIVCVEGLDDPYGIITVNDNEGHDNANGTIFIGPPGWGGPGMPDVTFDGSIMITEGEGGGDLNGSITVYGCHATRDDLDICICGDNNGTVTITQTSCTNQVHASCITGCP